MSLTFRRALVPAATFLALTALVLAPASHAQTVYTGLDDPRGARTNSLAARAEFLAALFSSGTDDIEAFADATPDPTLTFGTTGITAQTDVTGVFTSAVFPTSGTKALFDRIGDDRFTFSQAITGFGLNIISAGTAAPPTTLTLRLQNTLTNTSKDVSYTFNNQAATANVLFFGVTDTDAFNQVLFLNSRDADDGSYFDDVTAGVLPTVTSPVPEPSALALLLPALPLVGMALRRRKPGTSQKC